jgi:hypothetical protein
MEWIDVKERLPTKGESVGYTWDGKRIRHDVTYPGYNGSWESENSMGWYIDEKNVTYWMPLPEPPIDRDSAEYFMTKMTQKEFEERIKKND